LAETSVFPFKGKAGGGFGGNALFKVRKDRQDNGV